MRRIVVWKPYDRSVAAKPATQLPIEIIEYILDMAILDTTNDNATCLLYVAKWSRERFLSKRRKDRFSHIAQGIQRRGIVSNIISSCRKCILT